MTNAWIDEIYGGKGVYLGLLKNISGIFGESFSERISPRNSFEKFNVAQYNVTKQTKGTILDLKKLNEKLETTGKNPLIIIDKSDMTLLFLLRKISSTQKNLQKNLSTRKLYLRTSKQADMCIDILLLKKRLQKYSNAYSETNFLNFLFLSPLALLMGFPNIVALQQSVESDSILLVLNSVKNAYGEIFDESTRSVNLKPFRKVISVLSEYEYDLTEKIVKSIKSKKSKHTYWSENVDSYNELYYFELSDIENIKIDLSLGYIQLLIEMANYFNDLELKQEFMIPESPLLGTLFNVLEEIGDEIVYSDDEFVMNHNLSNARNLNRNPPIVNYL